MFLKQEVKVNSDHALVRMPIVPLVKTIRFFVHKRDSDVNAENVCHIILFRCRATRWGRMCWPLLFPSLDRGRAADAASGASSCAPLLAGFYKRSLFVDLFVWHQSVCIIRKHTIYYVMLWHSYNMLQRVWLSIKCMYYYSFKIFDYSYIWIFIEHIHEICVHVINMLKLTSILEN